MFIGYEPWEEQYFNAIESPDDLTICCGDHDAWRHYPEYNWVYNKIKLCETQKIVACPHGVTPLNFPVFSKPITNLYGMGIGARKLFDWDYREYIPGHFWMPMLRGEHLSTDFAVAKGIQKWSHTMKCHKDKKDRVEYWETSNKEHEAIIEKLSLWIHNNLEEFSGIVNLETIGNKIIDCHLRMSPQFVDLYGEDWLKSVINLYEYENWNSLDKKHIGYSVPLWTTQDGLYNIDCVELGVLKENEKISSIQITFDEKHCVSEEAGDNENYRLAVVNGTDLKEIEETIKKLEETISIKSE